MMYALSSRLLNVSRDSLSQTALTDFCPANCAGVTFPISDRFLSFLLYCKRAAYFPRRSPDALSILSGNSRKH